MHPSRWTRYPLLEWFFYGNFFYGVCAVALSVEASLQQRAPLNDVLYYIAVFLATVLYYNYPYARRHTTTGTNPRTLWNIRHHRFLLTHQIVVSIILLLVLLHWGWLYYPSILQLRIREWILLLIFPVVAGLYYGTNVLSFHYNLRSIGWLKPFIIGFTWAGPLVVYPLLYHELVHGRHYSPTLWAFLLFVKNMMFISLLCIMFDVKDYATDSANKLRTFVVQYGLRKTIAYILLPLPIFGIGTLITYALTQHFAPVRIAVNTIPLILLLVAAFSLRKRRPLMYYLIVIDGLMLVKAACGIVGMAFF